MIKKEEKRYIFIGAKKENNNLVISVKDSAGGVPEEIIDRIFEPYFTTKFKSQGTGIGLYMTEEIVVKHLEGTILVENVKYDFEDEVFEGAEFKITLPFELMS